MNEVGIHHIQVSSAKITEIIHNTQTFIWPNILRLKYFKYVCKRFKRIWPVLARTPPSLPPKLPHSVNSQLTTHGSTPLSAVSANAHQGIRIQTSVAAIATARMETTTTMTMSGQSAWGPFACASMSRCFNASTFQHFDHTSLAGRPLNNSPSARSALLSTLCVCFSAFCFTYHSLRTRPALCALLKWIYGFGF